MIRKRARWGTCYSIDPAHFEPDNKGKSTVIGVEPDVNPSSGVFDNEENENTREKEDSCPTSIITVTEM